MRTYISRRRPYQDHLAGNRNRGTELVITVVVNRAQTGQQSPGIRSTLVTFIDTVYGDERIGVDRDRPAYSLVLDTDEPGCPPPVIDTVPVSFVDEYCSFRGLAFWRTHHHSRPINRYRAAKGVSATLGDAFGS